jgi:2,3-bisphosphoglycerate-independent phosphoglycerate mutase
MARILADVVSEAGMTMFRTAETEKYAHVTYYFNGGFEPPHRGDRRPTSPRVRPPVAAAPA